MRRKLHSVLSIKKGELNDGERRKGHRIQNGLSKTAVCIGTRREGGKVTYVHRRHGPKEGD